VGEGNVKESFFTTIKTLDLEKPLWLLRQWCRPCCYRNPVPERRIPPSRPRSRPSLRDRRTGSAFPWDDLRVGVKLLFSNHLYISAAISGQCNRFGCALLLLHDFCDVCCFMA
jgi:hypothetical protein